MEGVLEGEVAGETSRRTSLMGLDDSDEFFDVSEPKNYDEFENEWHSAPLSEQHSQVPYSLPRFFHLGFRIYLMFWFINHNQVFNVFETRTTLHSTFAY